MGCSVPTAMSFRSILADVLYRCLQIIVGLTRLINEVRKLDVAAAARILHQILKLSSL